MKNVSIVSCLMVMIFSSLSLAYSGAPETILQRVVVPSADDPHGEVQLLVRSHEVVVRTVLYSPILKRVVVVIDDKERKRWTEESKGFVESQRYRDALFEATGQVWQNFRERTNRDEKRQALAIEFISSGGKSRVALFQPTLAGAIGALQIVEGTDLAHWTSNGIYVQENMVEILHENFDLERDDAREQLNHLVREERQ